MLTYDHVSAALQLLKKQFPGMAGLQNPVLGAVLQFAIASGPFVQVLHDGELHWVTVAPPPAHVDADVIVYDSLNRSVNMHCKMQIASLLSTTHSTIRCVVDTSQRQRGVIDCGLHVVETLLKQAKRACETTIITGLYSTETLYLVPDNLRKLSSLASYKRLVVEPFLFGQTLQALGLKEEHANAIVG
ncbi:hypothetical protein LSAT2_003921 [Lamellibrachia satsuma]|nr:hypothetical protein LSAT2_003921 [Lamellibrachia satsuma]